MPLIFYGFYRCTPKDLLLNMQGNIPNILGLLDSESSNSFSTKAYSYIGGRCSMQMEEEEDVYSIYSGFSESLFIGIEGMRDATGQL